MKKFLSCVLFFSLMAGTLINPFKANAMTSDEPAPEEESASEDLITTQNDTGYQIINREEVNYGGKYAYKFTMRGPSGIEFIAFCSENDNYVPSTETGVVAVEDPYENELMKKALYFGYGGPGDVFEGQDQDMSFIATTAAADRSIRGHFYSQYAGWSVTKDYWDFLANESLPNFDISLSFETDPNAIEYDTVNGVQRTEDITLVADSSNYIDIPVAAPFELYIKVSETDIRKVTDDVARIYGNQTFYIEAPLKCDQNFAALDMVAHLPGSFKVVKFDFGARNTKLDYQDLVASFSTPAYVDLCINFDNSNQYGSISIEKMGEQIAGYHTDSSDYGDLYTFDYTFQGLEGVKFEIIANEDIYDYTNQLVYQKDEVVTHLTTGSDGRATSIELPLGEYVVREVVTPEGYVTSQQSYPVVIEQDNQNVVINPEITIENKRQNVQFKLNKIVEYVDEYQILNDELVIVKGQKPAEEDIVFGLFTAEEIHGVPADSLVSIQNIHSGEVVSVEQLPEGKYYYQELKTSEQLVLDPNKYPVEYQETGNDAVIEIRANQGNGLVNKLYTTKWELTKQDIATGEPLPNTKIAIYDKDKKVIFEGKTNQDGKIIINELPVGDYFYQEIEAPYGYIIDTGLYPFSIKNDGETIVKADFKNKLAVGNINLEKKGFDIDEYSIDGNGITQYPVIPIAGAVFEVRAKEDIYTPDPQSTNGTLRARKGDLIATITTDQDGKATVTEATYYDQNGDKGIYENLFFGKYQVKEVQAPQGYELDPRTFNVTIEYQDQVTEIVYKPVLTSDLRQMIYVDPIPFNRPSWGEVEITKSDISESVTLPNTEIQIFDVEGKLIFTGATDENGKITIKRLPVGKYSFIESNAPEGYYLNEETHYFEILEDGEIVKCKLKDVKIEETPEKPTTPTTPTKPTGPKTGDSTSFYLPLTLFVLATAGSVVLYKKKETIK